MLETDRIHLSGPIDDPKSAITKEYLDTQLKKLNSPQPVKITKEIVVVDRLQQLILDAQKNKQQTELIKSNCGNNFSDAKCKFHYGT